MRVGNVKEIVFSKDPKQMNWLQNGVRLLLITSSIMERSKNCRAPICRMITKKKFSSARRRMISTPEESVPEWAC